MRARVVAVEWSPAARGAWVSGLLGLVALGIACGRSQIFTSDEAICTAGPPLASNQRQGQLIQNEFLPCGIDGSGGDDGQTWITVAQCACPLVCAPPSPLLVAAAGSFASLDGGGYCANPCLTTADCPTLTTICVGGLCLPDYCVAGADGGPVANGQRYGGPCDAAGTNDGTCIEITSSTLTLHGDTAVTFGLCSQGGESAGPCQFFATRSEPGAICPVGTECDGPLDGGVCR